MNMKKIDINIRDGDEVESCYRNVRNGLRQSNAHLDVALSMYKDKNFPVRKEQDISQQQAIEKMKNIALELKTIEDYLSSEWGKAREEKEDYKRNSR